MVLSNFALGTAPQCCQTSPLGVFKDCQTSPLRKYFCTRVAPSCSRAKFYSHVLGGVAPGASPAPLGGPGHLSRGIAVLAALGRILGDLRGCWQGLFASFERPGFVCRSQSRPNQGGRFARPLQAGSATL